MSAKSTFDSVVSELSSLVFGRSPKPNAKGGGGGHGSSGGGRGGGSSSGTKVGASAGDKSSGSIQLPKGGPGGSGVRGYRYPGFQPRFHPSADVHVEANGGNDTIVSSPEDDRRNLCPVMTDIRKALNDPTCTIKGEPAMKTYDSMVGAYDDIRHARDPRGYDEAANRWVGHVRSLRETECDGARLFQKDGSQEILGTAMGLWADWMENPEVDPMIAHRLSTSCSVAYPYVEDTGVTQEQIDNNTNDAKTTCDALVHVYDAGTFANQDSKAFFADITSLMSQTPYIDGVVSQLEPMVKQLRDAKLDETEKGVRSLQEKIDWLKGSDASKAKEAMFALAAAGSCKVEKTGEGSFLSAWKRGTVILGAAAAGGAALVAI